MLTGLVIGFAAGVVVMTIWGDTLKRYVIAFWERIKKLVGK